mgnify:CR=1 FL=1
MYAKYQEFNVSEINNIDDFFNIKPNENYILKTNLDFKNEVIQPIGKRNIPFSGSFNGNGFTISNFKIENNEKAFKHQLKDFFYISINFLFFLQIPSQTYCLLVESLIL